MKHPAQFRTASRTPPRSSAPSSVATQPRPASTVAFSLSRVIAVYALAALTPCNLGWFHIYPRGRGQGGHAQTLSLAHQDGMAVLRQRAAGGLSTPPTARGMNSPRCCHRLLPLPHSCTQPTRRPRTISTPAPNHPPTMPALTCGAQQQPRTKGLRTG